ncbi:hypothetical protein [Pseudonocardia alaniniphila]|uniref:hypothetical protein n=1 Tax=Pseudonocardia alaniniphila TaxID=75291 RepID=UPI0031DF2398
MEPGSTPGGFGRPGSGSPPAADPVGGESVPVPDGVAAVPTAGVGPALVDAVGVDVPVRRRSCTAGGEACGAADPTVPGVGAGSGAPLIEDSARPSTEMPRNGASSVRDGGEAVDEPSGNSEVVEFSIAR